MVHTDYYTTLEVPCDADATTIKKAYRKQALRYHPDKNKEPGAEDRFKKIARCYQVLSCPKKRALYDQFGESATENEADASSTNDFMDASSVFEQFFGGGGFMGADGLESFFGRSGVGFERSAGRNTRFTPRAVTEAVAHVSLRTLVCGGTCSVKLTDEVFQDLTTGAVITDVPTCELCEGTGIQTRMHMLGPGMFRQSQGPCSHCEAKGYDISQENVILVSKIREIEVAVPAGSDIREGILLPHQGKKQFRAGRFVPTDLRVRMEILTDADSVDWQLSGRNLVWRPTLHVIFGLASNRIRCGHLDGKTYVYRMTQNRTEPMLVPRHGLPAPFENSEAHTGDLIIHVRWNWTVQSLQTHAWFIQMRNAVRERAGAWLNNSAHCDDRCYDLKKYTEQERSDEDDDPGIDASPSKTRTRAEADRRMPEGMGNVPECRQS